MRLVRRVTAFLAALGLAAALTAAEVLRIAIIPRRVVRDDPYEYDLLPVMPPTEAELAVSREMREGHEREAA